LSAGIRKLTVRAGVLAFTATLVIAGGGARAQLPDELAGAYRELRKDFYVVMALEAAGDGRLRREHRRFLRDASSFMRKLGDEHASHLAAATYLRARVLLKCRFFEDARTDFDACLQYLDRPAASGLRAGGLPAESTIRILHAFTFIEEGTTRVLDRVEGVDGELPRPAYHDVGSLMTNFARALEDRERYDEALRAYTQIQRFELWVEEADNPQRKMDLIRLRQGGGALPAP
jgi:tetratricopeptide (TPR) repeat protein